MTTPSEQIERAALAALHAAAPRAVSERLRLSLEHIDGTLVSVAGALPDSAIVLNRAIGFGARDNSADALQQILKTYEEAGAGRFFLSPDTDVDDEGLRQLLSEAGLRPGRAWQKFRRGTGSVAAVETDLEAREIGPEHGEAFGGIVADAFDLGSAAAPWLAAMTESDGWHVFMTFDGAEPAGTGALYMSEGLAWTDFGATHPEHRRRGSQGALLAMRIRYALDHGCRQIFTCTGEAAPGDEQHSYRNILRMGFRKDYLRANYEPAAG